jgi:hypothetical protein
MSYSPYRVEPPRPDLDHIVSVDLGQAADYTAITIVQVLPINVLMDGKQVTQNRYEVRYLERCDLGTRYPAIVKKCLTLLGQEPLSRETPFVVDRTGVGRAVVDMFAEKGLEPISITIHGGDKVNDEEWRHYRVPKRDLIGSLETLYHSGRIVVGVTLRHAATLTSELTNFHGTINIATKHDSYEAWRESIHDDLVLAVAMACWYGEYQLEQHRPMSEETQYLLRNLDNPSLYL